VNDLLEYLRQEMRWGCSRKNMGTTNSHIKKLASETSLGKRDISAFLDVVEEVLEYDGMMHASRLDYKCIRSSSLDERSSPILSKSPSFLFPNIESTALMQPTMSSLTGPLVLISSKITFKRKLKLRRFSKSPMEYQLSRDHFKRCMLSKTSPLSLLIHLILENVNAFSLSVSIAKYFLFVVAKRFELIWMRYLIGLTISRGVS
jgi:hypothetical protein